MAPAKSNGRAPRLTWTREMRVGLSLIITEFTIVGDDRANVFNAVFAEELAAFGLQGGARTKALNAQWNESKTKEHWRSITSPPTTPAEADLRERIRVKIRLAHQNDGQPSAARRPSGDARNGPAPSIDDGDNMPALRRLPLHVPSTPTPAARRVDVRSSHVAHTPPPSPKRRRQSPAENVPISTHHDDSPMESQSKRARFTVANVTPVSLRPVIDRNEALQQALMATPSKPSRRLSKPSVSRKPRTPTKKFVFARPDGSSVMMSETRRKDLGLPLEGIPQHIAHPAHAGLLFRYWVKGDVPNHDSETGFIARKYYMNNVVHFKPPRSDEVDLTDVGNHMDRTPVATPYISTCNRLLWIIRLAMSQRAKGEKNGRITVIDHSELDKNSVFWARPFHDELTRKRASMTKGAYKYRGTYEFLVWRDIPQKAILTTISVADLLSLAQSIPTVGYMLRLDVLLEGSALYTKERAFRQHQVPLNSLSVKGIAKLAQLLGLTVNSALNHISHIVADTVQGWHLQVVHRDETEWRNLASTFARAFADNAAMGFVTEQKVRLAFLDGVRFGRGDVNARHTPETMVAMARRAKAIGLEHPDRIITNELDAVKLMAVSHEQQVQNLFKRRQQQLLLEEGFDNPNEDEEYYEEDEEPMLLEEEPPTPGPSRPTAGPSQPQWSWNSRMFREDEDDVESEFGGAFEFDAAGRVV